MSNSFGQAWAGEGHQPAVGSKNELPPLPAPAGALAEGAEGAQQEDSRKAFERDLQDLPRSELERAALARLCIWDGERSTFSLEEMLDLAKWVEARLEAKPVVPAHPLQHWRGRRLACLATATFVAFFVILLFVAICVASVIEGYKAATLDKDGTLVTSGSPRRPAGVSSAVEFRNVFEYPTLPLRDLRRVQDVVVSGMDGSLSMFRVARVSQLQTGGLQLVAEDGTQLQVADGRLDLQEPFQNPVTLLQEEVVPGAWPVAAGSLGILVPLQEL